MNETGDWTPEDHALARRDWAHTGPGAAMDDAMRRLVLDMPHWELRPSDCLHDAMAILDYMSSKMVTGPGRVTYAALTVDKTRPTDSWWACTLDGDDWESAAYGPDPALAICRAFLVFDFTDDDALDNNATRD